MTSAKAAVPTVEDQASSMALTHSAKNLSAALAELRTAAGKAHDACGSMDIDSALNQVHRQSGYFYTVLVVLLLYALKVTDA